MSRQPSRPYDSNRQSSGSSYSRDSSSSRQGFSNDRRDSRGDSNSQRYQPYQQQQQRDNSYRGGGRGNQENSGYRGNRGGGRGGFGGGGGGGGRPNNDVTEIDIAGIQKLKIVSENELPKEVPSKGDVSIEINGFALDLRKAKDIWMYDLQIEGKRRGRDKTTDLTRHSDNDAARNLKFDALGELFRILLQDNATFFHQDTKDLPLYVYDRSHILYSSLDLLPKKDKQTFILDREHLFQLEDRTYTRRFEEITVTLQKTVALNISEYATADKNTRSQIQAYVAVLTNQAKLTDFFIFDQKMFRKISMIPVERDSKFVIKEGLQKGARAIATEKGDSVEMMLQVDAKKAAFYAPMNLIDFILENNRGWRMEDLGKQQNWKQMFAQLRNLSVESTHLEKNRKFNVAAITKYSAADAFFTVKDVGKISVAQYFENKNKKLDHPNFPCIMESRNTNSSLFPLELLKVMDGQRVPMNKMPGTLTQFMLRQCQQKPAELTGQIKNEVDDLELNNSNDYLRHAGIRFVKSGQFVKTQGKELPAPAIEYGNKQLQLASSLWKLDERSHKFLEPAHIPKLAIIARDEHVARNYGQRLVEMAKQLGMRIDQWNHIRLDTESDKDEIQQLCRDLANRRYTFLFFIADSAALHSAIKYAEIPVSIPTQQMKLDSTRKGPDTTKNIIMKFNCKAGGKNQTIVSNPALKPASGENKFDFVKSILKSAIVIGLEMSHPPRVKIEPYSKVKTHEPTCVGIAATVDEYANSQSGGYFYQNGGTSIIEGEKLADKILDLIKGYHIKNHSYPTYIIIYRSGLSEGQFPEAEQKECEVIKVYLDSFYSSIQCRPPKISVIAVQRKTNYRIFKPAGELEKFVGTRTPAHVQNVTPGTTILQRGTNPDYKEFLMVPQKALLGTAKPIVGTVIFQSPAYSTNIEHMAALSNSLCYMHEICTSSISIPAPLKSAEQLAKRGKNNWLEHSRNFEDDSSSISSNSRQMTKEDVEHFKRQAAEWFDNLSTVLKVRIPGKYWA